MNVPEFDESLLTGQPLIDEQHRWLFMLAARVSDMVGACELAGPDLDPVFAPSDPCAPRLSDGATEAVYGLLDYVTEHFTDEEGLMRDSAYPAANYHASLHADLSRRLAPFVISEANAEPVDVERLVEFFIDWLTTHILHHDREFTTWLAANSPAVG
jgi:hemerythrin-like metal-binding protein